MDRTAYFRSLIADTEAVVFDFDNVIVDSEPFHYRAYAGVFAAHGHTLHRERYWLEWTSRGGGAEGEIARHGLELDPAAIHAARIPSTRPSAAAAKSPSFPPPAR